MDRLKKITLDEMDISNIVKLKTLADNDKGFRRYVYEITEEEQDKYGFEFIGSYSVEPDSDSFPINTTYRNTTKRCVFINTKHGWQLFLKDGSDGRNGTPGGGGMGYNDVKNLIEQSLSAYTPVTSGGGILWNGGNYNGIIELSANISEYTVYHAPVNINTASPVITLNIPNDSSEMLVTTIANRTSASFDIIVSQGPPTSGYSISWFIPVNYVGLKGITDLNTVDEIYTITHKFVDVESMSPILTLNIPISGSELLLPTVTNRTSYSFDIVMSQVPPISGYSVSWFIPTADADLYNEIVAVAASNVGLITSAFTNISGTNVQEAIESIDKRLNNEMILSTYLQQNLDDVVGDPEIIYAGYQNSQGQWYIRRVVDYNNGTQVIKHSNESNNSSFTTYNDAWTSRVVLNYSDLEELIFL